MIAMEPPNSFDAEAIRNEKSKVLKALRVFTPEEAEHTAFAASIPAGTR